MRGDEMRRDSHGGVMGTEMLTVIATSPSASIAAVTLSRSPARIAHTKGVSAAVRVGGCDGGIMVRVRTGVVTRVLVV